MTEAEWLAYREPGTMLAWLRGSGRASERRLCLFTYAAVRRVWPLLHDERSRRGIEIAELNLEESASADELVEASRAARQARADARFSIRFLPDLDNDSPDCAAAWAAGAVSVAVSGNYQATYHAAKALACSSRGSFAQERAFQTDILRDIIGNPFHTPPPLDARLLSDGLVAKLARNTYDERSLPSGHLDRDRLIVLADILEERGVTDAGLLGHLRSAGPHWRGCWGLDLVLGRS